MTDPTAAGLERSRVVRAGIWRHDMAHEESSDDSPPQSRLWNAASGQFDGVRLRAAIVARGWTIGEFVDASGVSRACLYNALRGYAVSDRTAIAIAKVLAARQPSPILGEP